MSDHPRLWHWYHCYADGDWRPALQEHIDTLRSSHLAEKAGMFISLVGSADNRRHAGKLASDAGFQIVAARDEGWEQVTLDELYEMLHLKSGYPLNGRVLYAHTKGASEPNDWNTAWRRSMTADCVANWQHCVDFIDTGLDAVGAHWLTPETYPAAITTPFFGGNFWWADMNYLRKLPKCSMQSRHEAEVWIGRENPKIHDLRPGWPGWGNLNPAVPTP